MNSRKKSIYLRIVCLLLIFCFCYFQAYRCYTKLQRNFDCISVRIQDQAVTKKQLVKALSNLQEQVDAHVPEIAAYHMTEHTRIMEPNLERTTYVTLYGVYGQMQLVTPSEVTSGNFVTYEDYAGCVIDEDSAFDIFGTTKATGQTIKIDQKEYYIRGVIKSEMPIVMIQEKPEDAKFWNLELSYGDLQQGREYANQLMINYGLSAKYIIIEQNFIGDCVGNLLVLPVLLLSILLIVLQGKTIHRKFVVKSEEMNQRHYRTKKDWIIFFFHVMHDSVVPLAIIAAAVGLFVITWHFFGIFPMRYFPTKWSDFNQYHRFYEDIKTHLNELSYVNPTRREVLLKQNCMRCMFFSGATLLLEWHVLDLIHLSKQWFGGKLGDEE